jgi:hypothetical protein
MLTRSPTIPNGASGPHLRAAYWEAKRQVCSRSSQRLAPVSLLVCVILCMHVRAQSQNPGLAGPLGMRLQQDRVEASIGSVRPVQTMVVVHSDHVVLDPNALFKVKKSKIETKAGSVKSLRTGILQSQPPMTHAVVDASVPLAFTLRTEGHSAFPEVAAQPSPPGPSVVVEQPSIPLDITYERGLLTIMANNTTLGEILDSIKSRTGATIDFPVTADNERATVKLGPAGVTGALVSLLQGSHFNYVIAGSDPDPGSIHAVLWERPAPPDPAQTAIVDASQQASAFVAEKREVATPNDSETRPGDAGAQFVTNGPPTQDRMTAFRNAQVLRDTQPRKMHREESPRSFPSVEKH